jgi:hypothetical protein
MSRGPQKHPRSASHRPTPHLDPQFGSTQEEPGIDTVARVRAPRQLGRLVSGSCMLQIATRQTFRPLVTTSMANRVLSQMASGSPTSCVFADELRVRILGLPRTRRCVTGAHPRNTGNRCGDRRPECPASSRRTRSEPPPRFEGVSTERRRAACRYEVEPQRVALSSTRCRAERELQSTAAQAAGHAKRRRVGSE